MKRSPMNILDYNNFYLVGIKGVAMTSLAQCLVDAGKKVAGSDLAEEFVTQEILNSLPIAIDVGFSTQIPAEIGCVIYTAAHQSQQNPQVIQAKEKGLPVFPQAEAVASLFNQKKGIAVCGVGGKSTTSAMIAWIIEKTGKTASYSIGVGNIPGLNKTGQWISSSEYFVAEADEYVIDPSAPSRNEKITPRFSFLFPTITVCTNLEFDHPDVYRDFKHTQEVYAEFFSQIHQNGALIVNGDNKELLHLAKMIGSEKKFQVRSFGEESSADVVFHNFQAKEGVSVGYILFEDKQYVIELLLPGKYNMRNAIAAIMAAYAAGIPFEDSIQALQNFRSTKRRAELIGEKNGVHYYDDYAHHPNEVASVIAAYKEWFPHHRLVVAFQSHTFSRTKALFDQFVDSFQKADEIVMIDIFASAREAFDTTISSDLLCQKIEQRFPHIVAKNVKTINALADYCQHNLQPGNIFLTVGAGDIYKVHELIK
jgi:UDP-N-acetylmuramate--alanine ligase